VSEQSQKAWQVIGEPLCRFEVGDVKNVTPSLFSENGLDPHPYLNVLGHHLSQKMAHPRVGPIKPDDPQRIGGFHWLVIGTVGIVHDRIREKGSCRGQVNPILKPCKAARTYGPRRHVNPIA